MEPFETRDYGLAGYLLAVGIHPTDITLRRPDVFFVYDANPALMQAIGDYTGNAPVACRNYFNALRKAKVYVSKIIQGEHYDASKQYI
ncbi:MAG: DUF5659 domain-containing protein [Bryobacterales bacterium]